MSDATLQVEVVAADRLVWSGEAREVIARTAGGEIGVLANHAPLLSVLTEGVIEVKTKDDDFWVAAVDSGFISVAQNRVSILSGHVAMSHEIDLQEAQAELDRAKASDDPDAHAQVRRAEARVKAAQHAT